jgi:hypothetical protein
VLFNTQVLWDLTSLLIGSFRRFGGCCSTASCPTILESSHSDDLCISHFCLEYGKKKSFFSKCVLGFHAMFVVLSNNNNNNNSVPAVVQLQLLAHVTLLPMLNVLHFHVRTFRTTQCATPNMTVVCSFVIDFVFSWHVTEVFS